MEIMATRQARYIAWVLSDLDRLYTLPHVLNCHTVEVPTELIESELFTQFVKPYLTEKQWITHLQTKQINVMYFSMNEESNYIDGVMWQPLHVPDCYDDKTLSSFLNHLVRKGVDIKEEAVEKDTLVITTFDPEVFAELKDNVSNFIRLLEFASQLDFVE